MIFRTYKESDYPAVCDFLVALNRGSREHINWNWARFEWMYEHPETDKSLLGSMGLWLDGDRVVGAALFDMYFGEAFCGALPDCEALYPEILDYAWRALRDENGLGVSIREGNALETAAAERAGFTRAEQTETVMALTLDGPRPVVLPEGLHIAEWDHKEDGRALQWLFWQGFDHGTDRAEFEREDSVVTGDRVHFNRRLSLAAVDADGEGAAYCCLWYLPGTDYAYVEPVCTVPAWRGRGAARAILNEAFNRAAALGAKRAYVISDQVFYERLGFRSDARFPFWWKR